MAKKSSPCLYIGIGCGVAVLLAVIVMVAVGFFVARKGQEFAETITDPEARSEKVQEILGGSGMPEGYHPMLGISIPFAFDMAILSDRPVGDGGDPQGIDESGFVYLNGRVFGDKRQNLIDYLEGTAEDLEMLENVSINLDNGEALRRGRFELKGREHLYAAYLGEIDTGDGRFEGIQVLTYVECDDPRVRLGIWFGPDPLPEGETPSEMLELTGTPADEAALMDFYRPLDPCSQ